MHHVEPASVHYQMNWLETAARSARIGSCSILVLAAVALPSQGCATSRRNAVPPDLTAAANLPGFTTTIRYFPREAEDVESFKQDFLDAATREEAYARAQ